MSYLGIFMGSRDCLLHVIKIFGLNYLNSRELPRLEFYIQSHLLLKTRTKTKKPNMYKVLLLNDDFTPMEFVVHILERFFGKTKTDAMEIMMNVHQKGVGICGVYTYEIAETKVSQVIDFSRSNEHPLQCTMEKE